MSGRVDLERMRAHLPARVRAGLRGELRGYVLAPAERTASILARWPETLAALAKSERAEIAEPQAARDLSLSFAPGPGPALDVAGTLPAEGVEVDL